jgi:hypothetical protein
MKLDGKTNVELLAMQKAISEDQANRNTDPSRLHLYTPKAQKKLDAILMQIVHNQAMKRAAEGNPVPCDGYSGRKQNRRR